MNDKFDSSNSSFFNEETEDFDFNKDGKKYIKNLFIMKILFFINESNTVIIIT